MTALVRMVPVKAAAPSLADNTGDFDRLRRAVRVQVGERHLSAPLPRLAKLAASFRANGFQGAALLNEMAWGLELADLLPAPPSLLPALALDLGTTHLEAVLLDLLSGRELGRATRENSQIAQGADILSRIHFAAREGGLELLHRAMIADLNALAGELAAGQGLAAADIRALSVAGNTAMTHFLLKLNPYHLCREPYIPVLNAPDPFTAVALGLAIHPAAPVWVAPNVGSYFGGDLLAGIVACDLDRAEQPAMLIDVGTNAEVVIGNREWLMACAGAAGPALEGGVAKMGMRAGPGAIERVSIDPDSGRLSYSTIGNTPPKGICGSGIIDLMAALYLAGMIDLRGKLLPEKAGERYLTEPDAPAFLVAPAEEAADNRPVTVSQLDLDALIRSKAAMYAILTTLVNQVGLAFGDIAKICVAGAFGRHIAPRQAIVLGMLPDLPLEVYQPVGNSSLVGASKALLDGEARQRVREVARRITYLELNVNQEFMLRFSGARLIPHTDRQLFPSVPVRQP